PVSFSLRCSADLSDLHSFPTRRSSDLLHRERLYRERLHRERLYRECQHSGWIASTVDGGIEDGGIGNASTKTVVAILEEMGCLQDRKSTRLNSSHVKISYAVFCLKKKN